MASNSSQNRNQIAGALTYPIRDENNVESVPIQPRQPRDLQGLLRFAMEATKAEDAPGVSQFGPMDEERRKFLEEALKSLTIDVAEILQKAIKVLTDAEKVQSIQLGQDLPEDVATSLSNIHEFVGDIDIANDFYKLGGFAIFPICFGSENANVRAEAGSILAEVCQNNPFCQTRALECGLLNVLLHLVQSEEGVALAKCLYAISCMTREFEPACRELTSQGGCAILSQLLHSDDIRVRTKVAFLIAYLVRHHPHAKDKFLEENIIKTIAAELDKGLNSGTSCLLNALLALVEKLDPIALQQLKNPTVGLKKILEKLWNQPELKEPEYDEERDCLKTIMEIFEGSPEVEVINEDGADR
ncbi:unnamed protein product [Parnassius apollo]|uniref:(apollo) hypothetical protein n=1 Tax=Parnassius apollo TaxID=110799 RepID=A0A8S3XZK2_PARAO|nr:unnamed protein product [Parnassius apollo]